MLCSVLEKTGLVGRPDEYINPRGPFPMHYERNGKGDLRTYFHRVWKKYAGPGGIFGIKTPFLDLSPFIQSGLFDEWFRSANMIYLSRSNIFEQAVSVVIARQSGVWHKMCGQASTRSECPLHYDPEMLRNTLINLIRERSLWESLFALFEITPMRIAYEEFAFDSVGLESTIRGMLRFLGYDLHSDYRIPSPSTSKLGSDLNKEWADRLRAEMATNSAIRRLIEWREGANEDVRN